MTERDIDSAVKCAMGNAKTQGFIEALPTPRSCGQKSRANSQQDRRSLLELVDCSSLVCGKIRQALQGRGCGGRPAGPQEGGSA